MSTISQLPAKIARNAALQHQNSYRPLSQAPPIALIHISKKIAPRFRFDVAESENVPYPFTVTLQFQGGK
jgi:hypothetical protein